MPLGRSPAPPFWWWSKSPVAGSERPPTSTRSVGGVLRRRVAGAHDVERAVHEAEDGDREDVVGVEVAGMGGDAHRPTR